MAVRLQWKNRGKVLKDIVVAEERLAVAGAGAVEEVIDMIHVDFRKAASLTDHTLEDLAALGHPYAVRAPQQIHSPNWLVHKQSGYLHGAIGKKHASLGSVISGEVFLDIQKAPHGIFVIFGTRKMIARDFMGMTLRENIDLYIDGFMDVLRMASVKWAA